MPDENAKARAALRLVQILTPAAVLGVDCPTCKASPYFWCRDDEPEAPGMNPCSSRHDAARAELHLLLLGSGLLDLGV